MNVDNVASLCDFEHSCAFSKKFPAQQESRFRLQTSLFISVTSYNDRELSQKQIGPPRRLSLSRSGLRPSGLVLDDKSLDIMIKYVGFSAKFGLHVRKIADCLKLFNIFNCTFNSALYFMS